MRLIDIGAFNGDSALHFISYPDIDHIDAYEPNKSFTDIWEAISNHYPSVHFYNRAVYTYTGDITFYQRPDNAPLGSTIMEAKIQNDENVTSTVPCIDILDIINDEPFCLKIDAEGAEYDILERLITSGQSSLVDRLYVEWHDSKMTSDNYARQIAIVNHFKKRLHSWL